MFTPSVSIVIPVYNGAGTIAACVQSVLAQEYPRERLEVIVVENGSRDATRAIVERYPVRLLQRSTPGASEARNAGIAASGADIIACTDADCITHPRWVTELVQPFADPQVGGSGGLIQAFAHQQRTAVERFCEDYPPLDNWPTLPGQFLPRFLTANAAYRRVLLERVGGFRADMFTGYDVDLSWRIQLETGTRLAYTPDAVVYHHHRETYAGLARQYRQYGFGEILLDTIYRDHPGYPRSRRYQVMRVAEQCAALVRYLASMGLRGARLATGRTTAYQAMVPMVQMLIEVANLMGKVDGVLATRFMTDPAPGLVPPTHRLFRRLVPARKE